MLRSSCRDREEHLRIFLNHIHGFLQKQLIDYGIYIVEQVHYHCYTINLNTNSTCYDLLKYGKYFMSTLAMRKRS